MKFRIFTIIISLLYAVASAIASDYVIAEGTAMIVSNPGESLESLRMRALAQARNNAVISKFGERNVSAQTLTMSDEGVKTASSLQSLAAGEWLGDVEEPRFENPAWGPDGRTMTLKVRVKGKIRRIPEDRFDAEVVLLRNGTEDRFRGGSEFFHNDDIFLKFVSPRDCYVAVYLLDPQVSSCLLPYSNSSGEAVFVLNNIPYIFFSKNYPSGRSDKPGDGDPSAVATYYLMAEHSPEINELYVIYSKSPFSKAFDSDNGIGLPRQLPIGRFQEWLTELRTKIPEVNLKTLQFTVSPK